MRPRLDVALQTALDAAIDAAGSARVLDVLNGLTGESGVHGNTLTIIVNSGVHHLPEQYKRGEVFVASEGSLDLSSLETIHSEFERILLRTAQKLKSHAWQRVYIIPFGPTPLSMQIKLLVYRVCAIESIDVMNIPGGERVSVTFDLRDVILKSDAVDDE